MHTHQGMPRTPLPSGAVLRNYRLRVVNEEFIQGLVHQTKRPTTEVLHGELIFARHWGLPSHFSRRLDVEASSRGITAREVVKAAVWTAASKLPRASRVDPDGPSAWGKRSSVYITGANDAFIMHMAMQQDGADYADALNGIVDFNRRFDLPADLLAGLTQHAQSRGATLRDIVIEILIFEAIRLPEAPAPAKHRIRKT